MVQNAGLAPLQSCAEVKRSDKRKFARKIMAQEILK